jgi:phage-related minor tail protein
MKLKAIISVALATLIVLATLHAVHTVNTNNQQLHLKEIKLRNVQAELNQLDSQYQKLQSDNSKTVQEKQAEIQRLLDKQKKLERQLEARRLLKAQEAKAYAASRSQASYGCHTGNWYKDYIYSHESSCRTRAVNYLGCYGIGQDCNGIVRSRCGANYACQDKYFSEYVTRRYGGWREAYNWWLRNHWY